MSKLCKRSFIGVLVLGLASMASPALAKEKSEDELIQELASPNADKVAETMLQIEKKYPTSTKALPTIKKLLKDPRSKVRRKAGRVLGALHAEVDQENLKDITAMLKASEPAEQIDALKSLRGLRAQETLPEILPLLQSKTPNVVRDACRTLAVLGNKETISSIEPLLNDPNPAIKKDAQDAIFALRSKS